MALKFKPSLNWLLVFIPVALAIRVWGGRNNDTALFICAGLAIIPLAGLMGEATEELARRLGHGIGGLLNATFGNAAELIIALLALSKGLVGVVKASITGSILGNILLVMGVSIVAGGLKYPRQHFNRTAVRSSTTSLALAAIALLIPTVFHFSASVHPAGWTPAIEQQLSLAIAVVLFATYACTLGFSLKTHKQLFSGGPSEAEGEKDEPPSWSRAKSVWVLLIATVLVALMSEFLVDTVESMRARFGFGEVFVGVIVVAIIGNAAEHSTAVLMALKNKMDLSLGIAIGSSLQIGLSVAHIMVLVSCAFGGPHDV